MHGSIKFIIGGGATIAMAALFHSTLGYGARFIDEREDAARTALGEAEAMGVVLSFERSPALRRIAVVSGTVDPATKERLLTALRAVPGVADAHWGTAHAGRTDIIPVGMQPEGSPPSGTVAGGDAATPAPASPSERP